MIDMTKVYGGGGSAGKDTSGQTKSFSEPTEDQQKWRRPSWFNPSTYLWSDWGHTGADVNPMNVQQQWFRDPGWGGHVVYNPDVGFQDYGGVEQFYSRAQAPVTQEQLLKQFTPQLSEAGNWRQYFPDRPVVSHQDKQAAQGYGSTASGVGSGMDWGSLFSALLGGSGYGMPSYGSSTGLSTGGLGGAATGLDTSVGLGAGTAGDSAGGYPNYMTGAYKPGELRGTQWGGVQLPTQWSTASNVMSEFAEGLPTNIPNIWERAIGEMNPIAAGKSQTEAPNIWSRAIGNVNPLAATGQPISQEDWYKSAKQTTQRDILDAIKQANEQAGLSGTRWSTPTARTAQDIAGKYMSQFGSEWADRQTQALENARARQMQAIPMQYQLGAGQAGLSEAAKARQMQAIPYQMQMGSNYAGLAEAAKNRGLQAAQGLAGLGGQVAQYPMSVASQSMNMGQLMTAARQSQLQNVYNEFLRRTEEGSPWTQMALQLAGIPTQTGQPMYNPGTGTSLLNILSSLFGLF
jgi:hypothetical protein